MGDVLECILFFCFIIFIASLFIESVLLPYWYICVPAAAVLALAWALPRLLRRRKAGRIRRVEAQIRACVEPLRMDILPFLSLLGQGIPPERAIPAAVWLHGRAGDLAAERFGPYGMTPEDLLQAIPAAVLDTVS